MYTQGCPSVSWVWPTVTVQLADLPLQVTVIFAVPCALAVTLPVVSTSATVGLSLVQVRLPGALAGCFTAEN